MAETGTEGVKQKRKCVFISWERLQKREIVNDPSRKSSGFPSRINERIHL